MFSVRPPIRVDVDAPAIAPKRGQVIVRVGDIVAGAAIPDFEIQTCDMADVARGEACRSVTARGLVHALPVRGDDVLAFEREDWKRKEQRCASD